jgi:phosphatidylglycerophosphate synthase
LPCRRACHSPREALLGPYTVRPRGQVATELAEHRATLSSRLPAPWATMLRRDRPRNRQPPGYPLRHSGAARSIAAFIGLLLLQLTFLAAMRRRIGPERVNPADLLTGCRALCATAILTAATVGPADDTREQGRRVAGLALIVGMVTDRVDGRLARRFGATRLGAVMDIEADSLLTLAMAVAAVRWGRLPRYVLIPPLLRYSDLVRTLRRNSIFTGDAIWWCRASGAAQMLLFLSSMVASQRGAASLGLRQASLIVSSTQLATQLLDGQRRFKSEAVRA